MEGRDFIKVGRGHDSEVRVTDISVSRCHALIKKSQKGTYVMEDNQSKFGTLVLIRQPYCLVKGGTNYLQMGRTLLEIQIKEPSDGCSFKGFCCRRKAKVPIGIKGVDEDYIPEEFLHKQQEFTREEELLNNT
mmetsp:Transcript_23772/g.23471  ORF Transcript_23772/g.23471 Transcript_23772/m.23471 type:complete len:133 (+) Transcript_23772:295-693(+)